MSIGAVKSCEPEAGALGLKEARDQTGRHFMEEYNGAVKVFAQSEIEPCEAMIRIQELFEMYEKLENTHWSYVEHPSVDYSDEAMDWIREYGEKRSDLLRRCDCYNKELCNVKVRESWCNVSNESQRDVTTLEAAGAGTSRLGEKVDANPINTVLGWGPRAMSGQLAVSGKSVSGVSSNLAAGGVCNPAKGMSGSMAARPSASITYTPSCSSTAHRQPGRLLGLDSQAQVLLCYGPHVYYSSLSYATQPSVLYSQYSMAHPPQHSVAHSDPRINWLSNFLREQNERTRGQYREQSEYSAYQQNSVNLSKPIVIEQSGRNTSTHQSSIRFQQGVEPTPKISTTNPNDGSTPDGTGNLAIKMSWQDASRERGSAAHMDGRMPKIAGGEGNKVADLSWQDASGERGPAAHIQETPPKITHAASQRPSAREQCQQPCFIVSTVADQADEPKIRNSVESPVAIPKAVPCLLCSYAGRHLPEDCQTFRKLPNLERLDWIAEEAVCYRCLQGRHPPRVCPLQEECGVDGCDKWHHRLLHESLTKLATPSRTKRLESRGPRHGVVNKRKRDGRGRNGRIVCEVVCDSEMADEGSLVSRVQSAHMDAESMVIDQHCIEGPALMQELPCLVSLKDSSPTQAEKAELVASSPDQARLERHPPSSDVNGSITAKSGRRRSRVGQRDRTSRSRHEQQREARLHAEVARERSCVVTSAGVSTTGAVQTQCQPDRLQVTNDAVTRATGKLEDNRMLKDLDPVPKFIRQNTFHPDRRVALSRISPRIGEPSLKLNKKNVPVERGSEVHDNFETVDPHLRNSVNERRIIRCANPVKPHLSGLLNQSEEQQWDDGVMIQQKQQWHRQRDQFRDFPEETLPVHQSVDDGYHVRSSTLVTIGELLKVKSTRLHSVNGRTSSLNRMDQAQQGRVEGRVAQANVFSAMFVGARDHGFWKNPDRLMLKNAGSGSPDFWINPDNVHFDVAWTWSSDSPDRVERNCVGTRGPDLWENPDEEWSSGSKRLGVATRDLTDVLWISRTRIEVGNRPIGDLLHEQYSDLEQPVQIPSSFEQLMPQLVTTMPSMFPADEDKQAEVHHTMSTQLAEMSFESKINAGITNVQGRFDAEALPADSKRSSGSHRNAPWTRMLLAQVHGRFHIGPKQMVADFRHRYWMPRACQPTEYDHREPMTWQPKWIVGWILYSCLCDDVQQVAHSSKFYVFCSVNVVVCKRPQTGHG